VLCVVLGEAEGLGVAIPVRDPEEDGVQLDVAVKLGVCVSVGVSLVLGVVLGVPVWVGVEERVGEPEGVAMPLAVADADCVCESVGVHVIEGVPDDVNVTLGVAVMLPLRVCVGEGQGSHIVTLACAVPNWLRHTSGSARNRAVELGRGQVAFAAPPDAGVGIVVVAQAESLSHMYTGGYGARPARPQVTEEKFVAVQATREPRGATH